MPHNFRKKLKFRACDNHTSVANNITKVESNLKKEERNKHVAVFRCWLEHFFPCLHLTPQGLICKEGKIDLLIFNGSFLETPFSTCVNQFASTSDEIEPHYGTAIARYLAQTHNIRTSCPDKKILLFDENASGVFQHTNLHPHVAVSHACSVDQPLFMSIGSVFGANVSPHNWEVLA